MNRIFPRTTPSNATTPKSTNRCFRIEQRQRSDVDGMLREIAYVLHLTRRVKAEILEENTVAEPATV